MAEVSVVKQAIVEGGLWDLVEERAKGHPQMTSALSRLSAYSDKLEESSPGFKGHGVFYYDHHSANRPQVTRHQRRLKANYGKPVGKDTVILLPVPSVKPFNTYLGFLELKRRLGERAGGAHFCFVAAPYGVVPELLAETYPLSQYEIAEPLDSETVESTAGRVLDYLRSTGHLRAVLVSSGSALEEAVERTISSLGDPVEVIHVDSPWGSLAAEQLLGKL
jgi:7-cyano-7-deazaguanine tRNA-ribosyltransferase